MAKGLSYLDVFCVEGILGRLVCLSSLSDSRGIEVIFNYRSKSIKTNIHTNNQFIDANSAPAISTLPSPDRTDAISFGLSRHSSFSPACTAITAEAQHNPKLLQRCSLSTADSSSALAKFNRSEQRHLLVHMGLLSHTSSDFIKMHVRILCDWRFFLFLVEGIYLIINARYCYRKYKEYRSEAFTLL